MKHFTLALGWLMVLSASVKADVAASKEAMVATVHPLATQAGVAAIRKGGNAVDAAVAAALTLGVVDGHNSGIGGGCLMLIRRADGALIAIDGRETAPQKASREMFLKDGQPDTQKSQIGPLAVATPGALAAYELAISKHGKLRLADLLLPAAAIAEEGFAVDRIYAGKLKHVGPLLYRFPGSREVFLKANGQPYEEGETLRQVDLAHTYRGIAEKGLDYFYRGPVSERIAAWMSAHGGLLSQEDFAAYHAVEREPVVSEYRGLTIVGFPPPSSGGVHVAQILNILERFELRRIHDRDPAEFTHIIAEAMKLAFADRAHWLGDSDFVRVPRGLTNKVYARQLAEYIDLTKAKSVSKHGQPPHALEEVFPKHTTHIAAADSEGNWVALTATVNTTFGSKVIVPDTGVVLNNEMDDFAIAPGVPNAFGLVGAEANAVQPGKRPLSSMSPTMVLRDGKPEMTVGAAGGPRIITQALLAIVRRFDLGMPLDAAIAAPRFHHQWSPDVLSIEEGFDPKQAESLRQLGHHVAEVSAVGISQGIALADDGETLVGVSDPRVPGDASGL